VAAVTVQCRLVEGSGKEPGDMWIEPHMRDVPWADELSEQYLNDWGDKREPIKVILPDRSSFCVDQRSTSARENGTKTGWTVTGEPPNLTCNPSIHIQYGPFPDGHMEEGWHGWLKDGVLE
jgi:hypothetical protein